MSNTQTIILLMLTLFTFFILTQNLKINDINVKIYHYGYDVEKLINMVDKGPVILYDRISNILVFKTFNGKFKIFMTDNFLMEENNENIIKDKIVKNIYFNYLLGTKN